MEDFWYPEAEESERWGHVCNNKSKLSSVSLGDSENFMRVG